MVAEDVRVSLGLLAVLLAGGSLAVSVTILIVVLRILQSTRKVVQSGNERLEILRELRDQQERLAFLHEERRLFLEELEKRRLAITEMERQRELAKVFQPEAPRSCWSRDVRNVRRDMSKKEP
jgi:biopolymer transport protein ExbB/TolQ